MSRRLPRDLMPTPDRVHALSEALASGMAGHPPALCVMALSAVAAACLRQCSAGVAAQLVVGMNHVLAREIALLRAADHPGGTA